MALLAQQVHVGHELHAHGDVAFALAHFAASSFGVEGEVAGFVAAGFGQGLLGIELAYLVVGFDVGGGVAAGGTADGVLVHQFHTAYPCHVAVKGGAFAHVVVYAFEPFLQHVVEHLLHQRGFARTAHPCHHGEDTEGDAHIDVAQIVAAGIVDVDAVAPAAAGGGEGYGAATEEVLRGERLFGRIVHQPLGSTGIHHLSAQASGTGTDVDNIVCGTHDFLVVFHHDDGVA